MIWYLIGINFVTFVVYGLDKVLAIKKMRRISEYSLFVLSFFGGSIGALLGMKIFHHKTKKSIFWILNFSFLVMWIIYLSINS